VSCYNLLPMERNRFEILRERLEEQLRADVELLYEAHRTKMRAFETVWRAQAELDPSLQPPPPPPASGSRRQIVTLLPEIEPSQPPVEQPSGPKKSLASLVFAVFNSLPEVFDKHDLCRALGFTPSSSSLHRVITELIEQEWIRLETEGTGRIGNTYRKIAMVADEEAETGHADASQ
jgi:hypothetical protein